MVRKKEGGGRGFSLGRVRYFRREKALASVFFFLRFFSLSSALVTSPARSPFRVERLLQRGVGLGLGRE